MPLFETEQDIDNKPLILIVDDIPQNLQVLGAILFQEGYELAFAENGVNALISLEELTPDLILLDVMMPDLDGFEVCKKIKSDDRIKDIPIIFITAKTEPESIVKGFELGAVDYISKPFNSKELSIRIKNHLELKKSREKMMDINKKLQKLLEDKNEYLGIAAHDMKNPLNSIIGFTSLTIEKISLCKPDCSIDPAKLVRDLSTVKDMASFMFRTINQLLNVETLESGLLKLKLAKSNISQIVETTIQQNIILANAKHISIFVNDFSQYFGIIDEDRFREIIQNLISNAIKYSPYEKNIFVSLNCFKTDNGSFLKFSVKDEGPGLTDDDKEKVFGKFQKLSAKPTAGEQSSGLGLSIVKRVTEMLNGKAYVISEVNQGAEFIVEIPFEADSIIENQSLEVNDFITFDQKIKNVQKKYMESTLEEEFQIDGFDENKKRKIMSIIPTLESKILLMNSLIKSNIINDIKRFAVEIRQLGIDNGIDILVNYGEKLNYQSLTFDIEKLPHTLKYYQILVEKLKNVSV